MMNVGLHVLTLLCRLLSLFSNALGEEIFFSTPETRSYTIVSNSGISVDDRFIIFKVEACKHTYVGLMSGPTENDPLHEIVFGGDSNTASFLRAGKSYSLPDLDRITGPILNCNQYVDFWIIWNDYTITVGLGLQVTGSAFLTWTSANPLLAIENIGIATAHGATGEWTFYTREPTTIEPTNDISTTQLATGETATPESQTTDLQISFDSTSLQKANSTGNLQTSITTIQYDSEEATTKADRNQTRINTIESTAVLPTSKLNIATPESKSTDRQVLFDSTSLPQATFTELLQMNKTTIPNNDKDVTTKSDSTQTSNVPLKIPDVSTSPMDKSKCSQSQRCVCQKRISNSTEHQDIYITKVTDYIWLKKCVLQPMIDSGVVKISECPYQCNCSPKGDTTTQEYDMFACVRRP